MLSLFDLAAVLLTLSALFGWLNHKYLPLPHTIGLLVMSVTASLVLVLADVFFPDRHLYDALLTTLRQIDFSEVVMNGMLAFLLFAGSLHIDLGKLRKRAIPVAILACAGTLVSTIFVGLAFWWIAKLLGHPISLPWSLVFGALISPTDPVAVLSTLKTVTISPELEAQLQGEALFNDGVGIVLFTVLLRFAMGAGAAETSPATIIELLVLEAGGGLLLGLITGYVAVQAIRMIEDYAVEVLITLALVTATYAIAQRLHLSGPLAMVSAGLLVGDRGPRYAMSDRTQTYLFGLWTLIDEILNSVLFLLIGLEVVILEVDRGALVMAACAIPIALLGRLLAVAGPPLAMPRSRLFWFGEIPFLTWAGVRGGISVALALSMPDTPAKSVILASTYAIVLFSIIVQGSTLGFVAGRTKAREST